MALARTERLLRLAKVYDLWLLLFLSSVLSFFRSFVRSVSSFSPASLSHFLVYLQFSLVLFRVCLSEL